MPSEYSGTKYTHSIKETNAEAKTNAAQEIPEMIEIALGNHFPCFADCKIFRGWENVFVRYNRHKKRNEQLDWTIRLYTTKNISFINE